MAGIGTTIAFSAKPLSILTFIYHATFTASKFIFSSDDSLIHLAGIFHNLYLKIYEFERDHYRGDSGWKFYIHNPLELPTLGVQTHGTSLYSGQGRDLRLDLKKVEEKE